MTEYQVNEKIRLRSMLVIDEQGNKLGELLKPEAIAFAKERNLDLVLISPNAKPPVAKIIDYGKFRYTLNKKSKKTKQSQAQTKVKEIYVKPSIGEHDLNWRLDNARKWLLAGNRVRLTVQTYGRMTLHADLVTDVYNRCIEKIKDVGKTEYELKKLNAKNHEVMIIPLKK